MLYASRVSSNPSISFLSIPSPDSTQGWVSGVVEGAEPADYVIVLYIQVDGHWWGPKPTLAETMTTVRSDRFWFTTFKTGGDDIHATRFAAFLVPQSALGTDMPPAVSGTAALPVSLSTFPSAETGRVLPVLRIVPSFERKGTGLVGLCFGPYLNGENPDSTILTEEVVRERLLAIRSDTTWVRSYGNDGGLEHFGAIAKSLGMKSAIGAWLTSDTVANMQALDSLIAAGQSGDADVLIVGSETLLRNNLTDRELVTYIQWVRREVPGVPVGTADVYGKFLEFPAVIESSDLLFIHIFPFWEGVGIDTAADYTIERYESVVSRAGGRPVVIAEMGWPDAGNIHGAAWPGEQNAVRYLHNMTEFLHSRNIPYFYFSAFDEAWKQESEGNVGPHWGIRDSNLTLKPGRLPQSPTDSSNSFHFSKGNSGKPVRDRTITKKISGPAYPQPVHGKTLPEPSVLDKGYIFISYKREELPRIVSYMHRIIGWGYPIWYDKGIPGGAEWDELIEKKIMNCDCLLVFLSKAAVDSKWVRREIKFADSENRPILGIRLDPDIELKKGLKVVMNQYQMINATDENFSFELRRAIDYVRLL